MYQKDFILRMLEMMGDLIAGILGMIKNGKLEQAEMALENAYSDFLMEDAALFRSLPKEKLTEKLIEEHNYTYGHFEILAGLFFTDAEIRFTQKKYDNCLEIFEKALILYKFVDKASKTYSFNSALKISLIQSRIEQLITK